MIIFFIYSGLLGMTGLFARNKAARLETIGVDIEVPCKFVYAGPDAPGAVEWIFVPGAHISTESP